MKELRFLKNYLKGRISITTSLLVIFLINGSIGFANDKVNDKVTEEFQRDVSKTILKEAITLDKATTKWENDERVVVEIIDADSIAVELKDGEKNNVSNNGLIVATGLGYNSARGYGYGISNSSSTETILSNNGVIIGNALADGTKNSINLGYGDGVSFAYGIYDSKSTTTDITNNGVILVNGFGIGGDNGVGMGYGYGVYLDDSSTNNIINNGFIFVNGFGKNLENTYGGAYGDGYGVYLYNSSVDNIINNGFISGNGLGISLGIDNGSTYGNGTGVYLYNSSITNFSNTGIIQGYSKAESKTYLSSFTDIAYGIYIAGKSNIDSLINSGIISSYDVSSFQKGNSWQQDGFGIALDNNSTLNKIENNGIIAGKNGNIIQGTNGNYINNGIEISLKDDGSITNISSQNNGTQTSSDGKIIVNGSISGTDSSTNASTITNGNINNHIVNGAGVATGALVIDKEITVDNSIINGYNTGVYLTNGNKFTATNTIINGGGFKGDIAVLRGDNNGNSAEILGTSIINGKVELGSGNDNLTIENSVQLNGELVGGDGKDILNLGKNTVAKEDSNLNILHNISGFENINTNGNLTLFETIKVSGADNINLESGSLLLRVDPTEVDSDGKVMGHALYENNGTLTSNGGNLVIGLNGLGENAIVSMGNTKIESGVNDSWWKESDHLKTNSLVLDAKLDENGNVLITVKESIPMVPGTPIPPIEELPDNPNPPIDSSEDSLLYKKLNKIYQSIVSSGELGKLANTTLLEDKTEEASLGGLLTLLNQMYANTPYSYTLKSTRDSLKLFNDNISYLTVKPQNKEYIAQGRIINTGVRSDKRHSGKNYYGFDVGTNSYKTTTNTSGAIGSIEYGVSDKTSLGFVIGGNNQDINFKGNNKIDASSLYLGVFGKTQIDNFKLFSGIGYQYTSAEAERNVINRYDSFKGEEKYNLNSFNAFIEGKYSYDIGDNTKLEPKVKLSYYYVSQDKIDEGYNNKNITMEVDKAHSNTADLEVGVDLVKSKVLEKGKLKGIVSLGVVNTLGDHSKELKGKIKGANKLGKEFDLQGVELPRTSGKVGLNLEYERVNGMIYTAGMDFEFAKDYNRNVSLQVGVGYRF